MEDQVKGRYSSYKVGFLGDFAAVTFMLTTPKISESSTQVSKYQRRSFTVTTLSECFGQAALDQAIINETDPHTLPMLEEAKKDLQSFIENNGKTNPNEAIDWEPVRHYS